MVDSLYVDSDNLQDQGGQSRDTQLVISHLDKDMAKGTLWVYLSKFS